MAQKTISLTKSILIYGVVSFFLFFEMAIQVSPSVMAPHLMHDLNIGAFGLGLMSGFYFYSYAAMQLPSGLLFDKHNPRLIITLSILICAIGTLLFAMSTNIITGSIARLFMGMGSAFAFVSVLVVTADLFPAKHFATMTGITQMLAAFGAMSGQLPISLIVSSIGWRNTLFVLATIGGLLAIIVWNVLKYQRSDGHPVNSDRRSNINQTLRGILTNSQTWMIAIYACLLWAPMSGFASLWGIPFLIKVDHLSPHSAAFVSSLMWLGLAFASPLLGWLSTRLKRRVIPLAISALIGAIAFGILLNFVLSEWLLGILLFLAGISSSGQALSFSVIKERNFKSRRATAIAFNNMAVVISGAIFQPMIGRLLQFGKSIGTLRDHSIYSSTDYRIALLTILLSYIIAFFIASFFIKETFCREQSED